MAQNVFKMPNMDQKPSTSAQPTIELALPNAQLLPHEEHGPECPEIPGYRPKARKRPPRRRQRQRSRKGLYDCNSVQSMDTQSIISTTSNMPDDEDNVAAAMKHRIMDRCNKLGEEVFQMVQSNRLQYAAKVTSLKLNHIIELTNCQMEIKKKKRENYILRGQLNKLLSVHNTLLKDMSTDNDHSPTRPATPVETEPATAGLKKTLDITEGGSVNGYDKVISCSSSSDDDDEPCYDGSVNGYDKVISYSSDDGDVDPCYVFNGVRKPGTSIA